MKVVEYGQQHNEVILLLHGGGLSWWNYKEAAEILSSRYHVILPILDGHAQSRHDFSDIEDNAERIISMIDEKYGSSVLLIGGLSLGGQVAAEILARRKDICRYAVLESASVIPSKLTAALIRPTFASSFFLIKQRWFARLQFRYLKIKDSLFEQYYADSSAISMENMISFLRASSLYSLKPSIRASQAKVLITLGEKELSSLHRSAQLLHTHLSESTLLIKKGLHHGEFSINHAQEYASELLGLIDSI